MKGEDIFDGITDIPDRQVREAERPPKKKRRRLPWMGAVAAVLAVALGLGVLLRPGGGPDGSTVTTYALAEPQYPEQPEYSEENWDAWRPVQRERRARAAEYDGALTGFLTAAVPALLSDAGDGNAVCSPLNVYMALSMLAEVTDGGSREQILNLLGAEDLEDVRDRASALWAVNYIDDGTVTSLLANSLWLDAGMKYAQDAVDTLAETYRASSFRGEMGSEGYDQALRDWINANTGNRLTREVEGLGFQEYALLALASTVYYRAKWQSEFKKSANTTGPFHAPGGDVEAVYMHQSTGGSLWQGQGFTALYRRFENSGNMWFILPEEGVAVGQLLSGELPAFLADPFGWENSVEYSQIRLAMPKFDVSDSRDLTSTLKSLGITDVFDPSKGDFSPILPDWRDGVSVSRVDHAARVTVDEEGVEAAAFTVIPADTNAAEDRDRIVDFILDRPFLFLITGDDGLPLFAGIVNRP